jgi:formamidase
MPETLIKVDLTKSAYENDKIHNRWHPDIPIVAWVNPGDDFIIETYDWTGGFIKNNDSADDVRDIDLSIVHFLSGPIGVKGAEPGDLLVVDLLDVGPLKESLWGFNGFFSKKNGGGFLTDHFPLAQKSIWDIKGLYTSSRHIPGVNFAGLIHPGLIGCLPDPKLLAKWNERETALIATNPTRVPGLANPPFAATAHAGQAKGDAKAKVGAEGARTVPPREHGGGPVARFENLLPGLCAGRRSLDGRPALQPGRRRNHLLWRDRDGRLATSEGGYHQGWRRQIRYQESCI